MVRVRQSKRARRDVSCIRHDLKSETFALEDMGWENVMTWDAAIELFAFAITLENSEDPSAQLEPLALEPPTDLEPPPADLEHLVLDDSVMGEDWFVEAELRIQNETQHKRVKLEP